MSNLFVVLICVFFNLINRACLGRNINIARVQNWIWGCVFTIYFLDIFKYYPLIDTVYLWVICYLLIFNIVYLFSASYKRPCVRVYIDEDSYLPYVRKITIASLFCWILSIPILKISIPILISSGMSVLRYKIYGVVSIYSSLQMMIIMYIMRPIFIISIIVFAIMIVNKAINIKYAMVVVVNIVNYTLMTSGRALMVEFFLIMAFTLLLFNGINIMKILKKYRKFILPLSVLFVIALYISSLRVTGSYGLLGEGLIYYTAGFTYLSELVKSGAVRPFTYFGRLIFSFIIDNVFLVTNKLGFTQISLASNEAAAIASVSLKTAPNIGTNATATLLLDLVLDAGVLGIIVGAVWLALLSSVLEKIFYRKHTLRLCVLVLLMMEIVFTGVQTYYFVRGAALIQIVLIFILLKPINSINKES